MKYLNDMLNDLVTEGTRTLTLSERYKIQRITEYVSGMVNRGFIDDGPKCGTIPYSTTFCYENRSELCDVCKFLLNEKGETR